MSGPEGECWGLVWTRFRGRSTHRSHVGPICPVCQTPLENHFIPAYVVSQMSRRKVPVFAGRGASRPCFSAVIR